MKIITCDYKDFGEFLAWYYYNSTRTMIQKDAFKKAGNTKLRSNKCINEANITNCCNKTVTRLMKTRTQNFSNVIQLIIDNEVNEKNTDKPSIAFRNIPKITYDNIDKYAEKFLDVFCPKALISPTKLDIVNIMKKNNIDFFYAPLDDDVFGMIYFNFVKTKVYSKAHEIIEMEVEPGTIVVNPNNHKSDNGDVLRNTLVHECVHLFFHANYFKQKIFKNEKNIDDIAIELMEWQATTLVPHILMPKAMVIQKIKEIAGKVKKRVSKKSIDQTKKIEMILDEFKDFFGVSLEQAQKRLLEMENSLPDEIVNYLKGFNIHSVLQESFLNRPHQYLIMFESHENNSSYTKKFLQLSKLMYLDNTLVVSKHRSLDLKKYELINHMLKSTEKKRPKYNISKRIPALYFQSIGDCNLYNPSNEENDMTLYYSMISQKDNGTGGSGYSNKNEHFSHKEFAKALEYYYKNAKKKKLFSSYEELSFETDISDKTLRSYVAGKTLPKKINIIKLGIVFKLSPQSIFDLLEKADIIIKTKSEENFVLNEIIFHYHKSSLEEIYKNLKRENKEHILQLSNKFLENHGLIE